MQKLGSPGHFVPARARSEQRTDPNAGQTASWAHCSAGLWGLRRPDCGTAAWRRQWRSTEDKRFRQDHAKSPNEAPAPPEGEEEDANTMVPCWSGAQARHPTTEARCSLGQQQLLGEGAEDTSHALMSNPTAPGTIPGRLAHPSPCRCIPNLLSWTPSLLGQARTLFSLALFSTRRLRSVSDVGATRHGQAPGGYEGNSSAR